MTGKNSQIAGSLFGLAFGDALGAPTEFKTINEILANYPPDGPQELTSHPALVTDDTQMMLMVGEALLQAKQPFSAANLEEPLRKNFIRWLNSPDNNRAPGMSCLTACEQLEKGLPWQQATVANSKGCGANMRVAPVGLLFPGKNGKAQELRSALAQFQAALTHGHATALAASDLTAYAVTCLLNGNQPDALPQMLRQYAQDQSRVYHSAWLGSLWQRPGISSAEEFIQRGWDECLAVLDRLEVALEKQDGETDPCLQTGAGWVAEEAFATGLLCFLLFPDDPAKAIKRAAVTSGDSDSIACLAGAFAGAYLGMESWPTGWLEKIEYRDQLENLAVHLPDLQP